MIRSNGYRLRVAKSSSTKYLPNAASHYGSFRKRCQLLPFVIQVSSLWRSLTRTNTTAETSDRAVISTASADP